MEEEGEVPIPEEELDENEEKKEQETPAETEKSLVPPSLYELLSPNLGEVIGRLIIVGKINSQENILKYFEKIREERNVDLTGLLLIQTKGMLCALESESSQLLEILNVIQEDLQQKNTLLEDFEDVKVVCFNDECQTRIFPSWGARKISTSKEGNIDLSAAPIIDAIYELSTNIWGLASKLYKNFGNQAKIENDLDNLKQNYPEFLPSNDRIIAFTESEDVMDMEEFLEIYAKPIRIQSHADVIWPAENLQSTLRGLY